MGEKCIFCLEDIESKKNIFLHSAIYKEIEEIDECICIECYIKYSFEEWGYETKVKRMPIENTGHIYFLRTNLSNNWIKIGRTENLKKRIQSLSSYIPGSIEILFYFETEEHKNVESTIHYLFKKFRPENKKKWFVFPDAVVKKLENTKKQLNNKNTYTKEEVMDILKSIL